MKMVIEKKKIIVLLIAGVMMMSTVLSGCSQKNVIKDENGININKKYSDEVMVNLDGTKHKYDEKSMTNGLISKETGIGVKYTEQIKTLYEKNNIFPVKAPPFGCAFVYRSEELINLEQSADKKAEEEEKAVASATESPESLKVLSQATKDAEKELEEKSEKMTFEYAAVYKIPDDKNFEGAKEMEILTKELYKNIEKIAVFNKNTYYLAYNTDYSNLTLNDKDKANIKNLIDDIKSLKNNICIFPEVDTKEAADGFKGTIDKFNAKTLDGQDITENSFKDYDITMINIWATYCGPCKEEMPELQKLYEKLPQNVNMISICTDATDERDLAKEIIDSAKGKFKVIISDENLEKSLLSKVNALPTTIFVDKSGKVVGEAIIGAASENGSISEGYLKKINECLQMAGK